MGFMTQGGMKTLFHFPRAGRLPKKKLGNIHTRFMIF